MLTPDQQTVGIGHRTNPPLRRDGTASSSDKAVIVHDLNFNRIPQSDLESGLLGLFSVFGRIADITSFAERASVRICFESKDSAASAMRRLQRFPIWGRPLRLTFANETRPPSSAHSVHPGADLRHRDRETDLAELKKSIWPSVSRASLSSLASGNLGSGEEAVDPRREDRTPGPSDALAARNDSHGTSPSSSNVPESIMQTLQK